MVVNMQHEWVENAQDYEAVLVCMNELGAWNKDSSLRAYQTWGWNDASTAGNDLSFIHIETGVIVRHEGAVVAIDFGGDNLSSALSDLFSVLHALGWKLAEVHHPAETISGLLGDMGKAIPANMDFDIRPAKNIRAVSMFAEGAALVERGRSALQMGGGNALNNVLMGELESMGAAATAYGDEDMAMAPRPFGTIVLSDDNDDLGLDEVTAVRANERRQVLAPNAGAFTGRLPDDIDSEQPQVFKLSAVGGAKGIERHPAPPIIAETFREDEVFQSQNVAEDLRRVAETHADEKAGLVIEIERLQDALSAANRRILEEQETRQRRDPAVPQPAQSADLLGRGEAVSVVGAISAGGAVLVGSSAFCFDLPAASISDDEVKRIADRYGLHGIVHLRPGAIGETLRWDVLGEIDPDYPLYAEKLVRSMNFDGADVLLIANVILALQKSVSYVQLRDLLIAPSDIERIVSDISHVPMALLCRPGSDDLVRMMNAMMLRMGALLLCPEGRAFVDLRPTVNDLATGMQEAFTVREVMQSPLTKLFVVHVDALDGPFVSWIAGLLRAVAIGHAATKRYQPAVAERNEVEEKEREISAIKARIAAEMSGGPIGALVAQLRGLGIEV